jgi:hypothetical protein
MKGVFMKIQLIPVIALIVLAFASSTWAGGACCGATPLAEKTASVGTGKAQTMCPVLDEPINKDVYVDHAGQRVYFCCAACKATFAKDPEKYIKKLQAGGVEIEKAPAQE